MWDMRDNISTYDASYVALAEALDIPLMTTDHRLARAAGPYCQVAPR
jgi:predicted nucleic acid-binding protein